MRVVENSKVATNWCLHNIVARDGLGNFWYFGETVLGSNDWRYNMIWSGLDPSRVWKIEAHLARDSGFPAEDMCTVPLRVPLRSSIRTNLLGLPVQIGFVNSDMLAVEMLTNRADLRLSFVSATDKNGKSLDRQSGNWGQWHF